MKITIGKKTGLHYFRPANVARWSPSLNLSVLNDPQWKGTLVDLLKSPGDPTSLVSTVAFSGLVSYDTMHYWAVSCAERVRPYINNKHVFEALEYMVRNFSVRDRSEHKSELDRLIRGIWISLEGDPVNDYDMLVERCIGWALSNNPILAHKYYSMVFGHFNLPLDDDPAILELIEFIRRDAKLRLYGRSKKGIPNV